MKINEIIKERRLAKKLTQEQIAAALGVTAPAVNKWEKGSTYPDITLLPALARLLETDLNTLLSFQSDLTEEEIWAFLNGLPIIIDQNGFEQAYEAAMQKIKEFPTCDVLILNSALFLDGALMLDTEKKETEKYKPSIELLYERLLSSEAIAVRSQAQSILVSKYMGRKEYDRAQALLEQMPDKIPVDKKRIEANLLQARGKLDDAFRLQEEKLLGVVQEMDGILFSMIGMALEQEHSEDAEYFAGVAKQTAELFDLWEYQSYVPHFQLYVGEKDQERALKTLIPMVKSLAHPWDLHASPLYRHMKTKEMEKGFADKLQKQILASVCTDEQTAFLRESKEFQDFLDEMERTDHSLRNHIDL